MKLVRYILLAAFSVAGLSAQAQSLRALEAPQAAVAHTGPLTRRPIAVRSAVPIGHGCVYRASVRGAVRARRDVTPVERVHDADLRTHAVIACNGRVVNRRDARVVIPAATVERLSASISKGLRLRAPDSPCEYSQGLRFSRDRAVAREPEALCQVTPVAMPTTHPSAPSASTLADQARFGAH
jgi:hypothetical protein